ncbi:MAG: DUF2807 domain-containing protein, partial [Bacteroidales bacterium]|nr:DUF2807 domain-containing protein [Bacteroidales bacterium]
MKNIVILLSLSLLFFGCTKDWGTPVTKNYPINGAYTKLDVSNAFDVTVSDQVTDVVVTVGELAHDRVVVRVVDGELQIGFKPNTNYSGKAKAVIPATVLRKLDLSGASSFTGDLRGDDVDIELSGASTYRGTVVATELDIDLSGASDAILSGACQTKMGIDLSGASTLKAANLSAMSVFGEMSGASDADVTVCSDLNVELSGAST